MILPIKSQGYPSLLNLLGVQSPLQGPFWGFESTVLPIIKVGSINVDSASGVPWEGVASNLGTIGTPAANATLANTSIGWMKRGFWALHCTWFGLNTTVANGTEIRLERLDQNSGVTLDFEQLDAMSISTGQRNIISGFRDIVLWNPTFGDQFALRNTGNLPTAGSLVSGRIRWRYLGEQLKPENL